MPRTARTDGPEEHYHLHSRGVDRGPIFLDGDDRRLFVARLFRILAECLHRCLVWTLMPNHYHVIVFTGPIRLGVAFQRINMNHAQSFNRKYARTGHLFENRYEPHLVDTDDYFRAVVRYVLLNPVHSGIVPGLEELADHPWTSYSALIGRAPSGGADTVAVLRKFGDSTDDARRNLERYLREGVGRNLTPPWKKPALPAGWTIDRVIEEACQSVGVSVADVRQGRKQRVVCRARALAVHLAVRRLGLPQIDVAAELGLSRSGVSQAVARGARIAEGLGIGLDPEVRGPLGRE